MTSKCHKKVFEVKNGILTIDLKTFLDMIEDIIDRAKRGEDKYDILDEVALAVDEEFRKMIEDEEEVIRKIKSGEIKTVVVDEN